MYHHSEAWIIDLTCTEWLLEDKRFSTILAHYYNEGVAFIPLYLCFLLFSLPSLFIITVREWSSLFYVLFCLLPLLLCCPFIFPVCMMLLHCLYAFVVSVSKLWNNLETVHVGLMFSTWPQHNPPLRKKKNYPKLFFPPLDFPWCHT